VEERRDVKGRTICTACYQEKGEVKEKEEACATICMACLEERRGER